MAISTYYAPRGSSVSDWDPKKGNTTTDEWLSENMPWTDHSDDDLRRKLSRAGITPSAAVAMTPLSIFTGGAAANLTGMSERAIENKSNEDDPYAPQRADVRDVGLKEYIKEGGMAAPDLSEEEQKHWDDYQDYQKETLKKEAADAGGVWGAIGAAIDSSVSSEDSYAQSQIDLEEKERAKAFQLDAARLAEEAAVATARLSAYSSAPSDEYLSSNHTKAQSYDEWWDEMFNA